MRLTSVKDIAVIGAAGDGVTGECCDGVGGGGGGATTAAVRGD